MKENDGNPFRKEMPLLIAIPQVAQCCLDSTGHELFIYITVSTADANLVVRKVRAVTDEFCRQYQAEKLKVTIVCDPAKVPEHATPLYKRIPSMAHGAANDRVSHRDPDECTSLWVSA